MFVKLDFLVLAAIGRGIDRRWIFDVVLNLVFPTAVVRSYQAARDSRSVRAPA
jgi:hypothetical protein